MSTQALALHASARPGDNRLGDFGVELSAGEVVQKEQGRGALHGNVVDAVIDEVRAHIAVHPHLESDFELGAHSIGGANQDGILPALQIEAEKRSKTTDATHHIAVESLLGQVLDALFGAVAAADVHACVGVGDGFCLGFFRHGAGFLRLEFTPERLGIFRDRAGRKGRF